MSSQQKYAFWPLFLFVLNRDGKHAKATKTSR